MADAMNEFDISTEEWREYQWPDGNSYRVRAPKRLFVKQDAAGDSHRVLDADGVTHYPKRGWVAITWFAPSEPVSF